MACACASPNASAPTAVSGTCLDGSAALDPVGSAYVCGGTPQGVSVCFSAITLKALTLIGFPQAVPCTLSFSNASIAPVGLCANVTLYPVSLLRFVSVSPSQTLSTYWTQINTVR